ncbi:MAG: hypothetical protein NT175_07175 [Bacteroidetes bacterium]|nr:hypothetical protein [Bacteroidota bacterium]
MPKACKAALLIIPALFSLCCSFAQIIDTLPQTVDSSAAPYFYEKDFILNYTQPHQTDTLLDLFQKYDPLAYPLTYYATLGNIGLAHKNLVFSPSPTSGFDLGQHAFDQYLIRDETIQYYLTPKPFTRLYYVQGKYREQVFDVLHNQQIGKNFNVGVHVNILSAFGGYERQRSNNKSVTFFTSYYTPNKRYGLIANFLFNNLIMQENGGIASDSVFENKIETESKLIAVNLLNAENRWKNSGFKLIQYYSFSKKDVLENDTVKRTALSRIFSPGSILYAFSYTRLGFQFIDNNPDTLFFSEYYSNPEKTYDETLFKEITNMLMWTNSRNPACPLRVYAGVKHQHSIVLEFTGYNPSRDDTLSHLIFSGGVTLQPFAGWKLKADAEWVKGNYIKDDQKLTATLEKDFGPDSSHAQILSVDISYYNQTPSWFLHHYNSNHFRWDNAFTKPDVFNAGFRFQSSSIKAGADYYRIFDYIYFGTDTLPHQSSKTLDVASGFVSGNLSIHRFDLMASMVYQYVSDKQVVSIPELTGDLSAYFNQDLFKHALGVQLGFDLYYTSAYFADAYMPATRLFFIQDEKKINQVFVLDALLKFKVKYVRFFLMYHHLNSLIGKKDYYKTLHYPIQEGRLKFGINWIFHD